MIHATSQGRKRKAPPYTGIGEEVFVVYGRAAVGAVTVNTGDYLWTPPNGTHGIIE